jgi:hypothetical protein
MEKEPGMMKISKKPKGEKKLHRIEVELSKDGGVAVTHHFHPTEGFGMMGETRHPPEKAGSFGPEEGKRFMEHMAKHTGMKMKPGETDEEGLDEGQGSEAGEESEKEDTPGYNGEEDD